MAVPNTFSQSWVTVDSSRFSDDMSDEVTIAQQRKEELVAMAPPSEKSSVSENSRRTEQWVDETCRDRTNEVEGWPNSNVTNEFVAEEGCSRAPPAEEAQPGSQTDMEQDLTYVGGMSYARPRGLGTTRGPTRVCAYGKHKEVRPPMLNAGERRQKASRVRSMTGSLASSQRSSVYKTALLDAQAETQRALAGLASTPAECNEQHLAIVENNKVMQTTMCEGLQVSDQLRTAQNVQNARVDTLGHRMGEMNDKLMAREFAYGTQRYRRHEAREVTPAAAQCKWRCAEWRPSPCLGTNIPEPRSEIGTTERVEAQHFQAGGACDPKRWRSSRKFGASHARRGAQACTRADERTPRLGRIINALRSTRDQGVDPMSIIYLDSSVEADLSSTKATLGSQTEGTAFTTVPISMLGPDSLYLTGDL